MSAFAGPSVRSIIFENIETTRNFGSFFLHAAELSHVKSALNLLAAAKQTKNKPLADAMRHRIDEKKSASESARHTPIGKTKAAPPLPAACIEPTRVLPFCKAELTDYTGFHF